ncbi:hypothetical protein [Hyphomicrobium sp.]|uniref:hypothetical protein n=1 Tax=Hyphomicrobium sp. TaxID=82 RepID=UPI002FE0D5C7
MARKQDNGWRRGEFDVQTVGGMRRVVGSVSGRFGIHERAFEDWTGAQRRVSYLILLSSGIALAPFATRREARLAAQVIADLEIQDTAAIADRWMAAGFYISGDHPEESGHMIWRLLGGALTDQFKWAAIAAPGGLLL